MKTKLWTKNFIMITAINLLIFFGFQVMLVTLPLYAKTLGAGDSYIGAYAAALLQGQLKSLEREGVIRVESTGLVVCEREALLRIGEGEP